MSNFILTNASDLNYQTVDYRCYYEIVWKGSEYNIAK